MGLALFFALAYLLVAKKVYTCTATVQVRPISSDLVSGDANVEDQDDTYLSTQCQIIESAKVAALTLMQPGVREMKTLGPADGQLDYLRNHVSAQPGKNVNLIEVSVDSPYPDEGCKLADAVVNAYAVFASQQNGTQAQTFLTMLQGQMAQAEAQRKVLLEQIDRLDPGGSLDATNNNSSDGGTVIDQQLQTLRQSLDQASRDAVTAYGAYDEARQLIAGDAVKEAQVEHTLSAATPDDVPKLRAEVFRLQEGLTDLERTYLPEHPLVLATRARLEQLTLDYVAAARQTYLDAERLQNDLQDRYNQERQLAASEADEHATLAQLDDQQKRLAARIDGLNEEIVRVDENQREQAIAITQTDPGEVAGPPKPSKSHTLAGFLAIGFIFGGLLALVRDKTDARGRASDRSGAVNGVPVLGIIPPVPTLGFGGRPLPMYAEPTGEMAASVKGVLRLVDFFSSADAASVAQRCQTLLVT
ncbi:MAG TPA: hypothetical protein VMD30_08560, partial [Tepidisphaeraceae bacterium]|nr:hypothetical protein [Tepidisphaeraceae bacterium]